MSIALFGILQQGTASGGGGTPVTPYSVWVDWTLGISGTSWRVTFDNNNGGSRNFNLSFGSGSAAHRSLAYFDDTMKVTIEKLNNGGLAEDAGSIQVQQNGITIDSTTFLVNDDMTLTEFDLTGLVSGDQISVILNEG